MVRYERTKEKGKEKTNMQKSERIDYQEVLMTDFPPHIRFGRIKLQHAIPDEIFPRKMTKSDKK